jgi:mercuric ion binding protein
MMRLLKKTLVTSVCLVSLLFSSTAYAEKISITVKGMVCSFCAQGIKKTFERKNGVEKVEVDLDKKIVTISSAQGATLSDDDIKKAIKDAGYEVLTIERTTHDK